MIEFLNSIQTSFSILNQYSLKKHTCSGEDDTDAFSCLTPASLEFASESCTKFRCVLTKFYDLYSCQAQAMATELVVMEFS